ncbi:hypothetical protein SK128_017112, partial [Halocaridina rubra]
MRDGQHKKTWESRGPRALCGEERLKYTGAEEIAIAVDVHALQSSSPWLATRPWHCQHIY